MLLAIDVGNTNLVCAVFSGDTLLGQWRLATRMDRTADEYAITLQQLLALKKIPLEHIEAAIIGCVVPPVLFPLGKALREHFMLSPLVVGEGDLTVDMPVLIDRPQELGADRLVNAFAARHAYGNDLLVLDFGTATTFDLVNGEGAYAGGVIAPGVNLSLDALQRAASKLPRVAVQHPKKVIGSSTVSAMESGIYYGYVAMIEGLIQRIENEYGHPLKVVATGGLAGLFNSATHSIQLRDTDLTINGLKLLYTQHQMKA